MATTPQTVIPIVSTAIPSTLAASLAPTAPLGTSHPIVTESIATSTSTEKITYLVKAMEETSIQATELKQLKEKIEILETNCKVVQIQHKEEAQNSLRMGERIKFHEKDLTLQKPLGETKEMLWANIIEFVNDVWPSIQAIFEQTELVKVATEVIQKIKEDLGDQPKEASQLIQFLNNKNREELGELGVEEITETILQVKKVLTKGTLSSI